MMRSPEPNSDLGGIGTMLVNAEICAACGEAHPEPRFLGLALRLPGSRACPVQNDEPGPTLSHGPAVTEAAPSYALPVAEEFPDEVVLSARKASETEFAAPWPVPAGVF